MLGSSHISKSYEGDNGETNYAFSICEMIGDTYSKLP